MGTRCGLAEGLTEVGTLGKSLKKSKVSRRVKDQHQTALNVFVSIVSITENRPLKSVPITRCEHKCLQIAIKVP